jgi:hypothetical protein
LVERALVGRAAADAGLEFARDGGRDGGPVWGATRTSDTHNKHGCTPASGTPVSAAMFRILRGKSTSLKCAAMLVIITFL